MLSESSVEAAFWKFFWKYFYLLVRLDIKLLERR